MIRCLLLALMTVRCAGRCGSSFRHDSSNDVWLDCEMSDENRLIILTDVIYASIHDYTYIKDVSIMCDLVRKRLYLKGIEIVNVSACSNTTIDSEYANTLTDLYYNFAFLDDAMVIRRRNYLTRNQQRCHSECNVEDIFGGSLDNWFEENVPELKMPDCVFGNNHLHFNLKRDSYGYYYSECEPFSTFNPNITNWNWTIYGFEECIACLEWTDLYYVRLLIALANKAIFDGVLIPEIVSVWRRQMPSILSRDARVIKLNDV